MNLIDNKKPIYHINENLIYNIKNTTGASEASILSDIQKYAIDMYYSGSKNFKISGNRELKGFWPNTSIFFRIILVSLNRTLRIAVDIPRSIKSINGDDLNKFITESEMLDSDGNIFKKPKPRTPRGLTKLDHKSDSIKPQQEGDK